MNYASALLNVSSTEERVVSPSQQPLPQSQPQKPQSELPNAEAPVQHRPVKVRLEGNNGGDIGRLLQNEKKDGSYLECILTMAGPATSAALSQTCKHLDNLITTKSVRLFNKMYKNKIDRLKVVFTVDFEEKGEVKRLPVSSFSRRQRALTKYWKGVVNDAQDYRDNNRSRPLQVTLNGGFVLYESDIARNETDIILQNDLSQTVKWLQAIINLLNGRNSQTITLSDGKVVLTRYGLGGSRICVEVHHRDYYTVRRYDFGMFCLEIRDAIKVFIPIVGACAVEALNATNVPAGDADRVLECEKVFKQVLMHADLRTSTKDITKLLSEGAAPRSNVNSILKTRGLEKQRIEKQKRIEDENMYHFLLNNIPEDFERVEEQKRKLDAEAEEKINQERKERERARLAKLSPQTVGEESVPLAPKHKIKKVKEVDDEGFTVEKSYIIKETGGKVETESIDFVPKESTELETKKEKKDSVLDSNPFSAFLMEGQFASISETQHQRNMNKANSRIAAEEKTKLPSGKGKKAASSEKAETNVNQKNKKNQTSTNQVPVQNPTQQTQAPKSKQVKKSAPKSKAAQKKKADSRNARQTKNVITKQKQATLLEHELFQPSLIALVVVGFVAAGYIFLFNATPL